MEESLPYLCDLLLPPRAATQPPTGFPAILVVGGGGCCSGTLLNLGPTTRCRSGWDITRGGRWKRGPGIEGGLQIESAGRRTDGWGEGAMEWKCNQHRKSKTKRGGYLVVDGCSAHREVEASPPIKVNAMENIVP